MVPKYPLEGGKWDKAGEAIDVEQVFDFCHADIMTEFRSIAIIIPPDFFQGIRALKGESYPLKFTKSLLSRYSVPKPDEIPYIIGCDAAWPTKNRNTALTLEMKRMEGIEISKNEAVMGGDGSIIWAKRANR